MLLARLAKSSTSRVSRSSFPVFVARTMSSESPKHDLVLGMWA